MDLKFLIVCEDILDFRSIEFKICFYFGAFYGMSFNNCMVVFMWYVNFFNWIRNLYFCGGSVYFGGGILFCLFFVKIVEDVMEVV